MHNYFHHSLPKRKGGGGGEGVIFVLYKHNCERLFICKYSIYDSIWYQYITEKEIIIQQLWIVYYCYY